MARLRIGHIDVADALLLAPMEDVTDRAFRLICRRMGADIVYTEFISSDGLVRNAWRSVEKLTLHPQEHPVAVQIFGGDPEVMAHAARIAEQAEPDFLDINCGCWVQNVVARNAGAALLRDPDQMVKLVRDVVRSTRLPVTVKTRLGWSRDSIVIVELAQRLEEVGIAALCVHCRTRDQGHSGSADWSWIPRIKERVSIPVILNGDVRTPEDVRRAFEQTGCDGVMIGRAAIGNPFIFQRAKEYLRTGVVPPEPSALERIQMCLEHLRLLADFVGEERAVCEFRRFYAGYLRGLYGSAAVRNELMQLRELAAVEDRLLSYAELLRREAHPLPEASTPV
ncbi:MAG: tRNA dihydrouridine synthase DusB [Chlorobiota bacterium]|nr:tRNA dihydrouridine synthase DusB [Chlorobiota bacterium]